MKLLFFINVTSQGYYFSFYLHLGLACVYFVAHFYGPSVSVFWCWLDVLGRISSHIGRIRCCGSSLVFTFQNSCPLLCNDSSLIWRDNVSYRTPQNQALWWSLEAYSVPSGEVGTLTDNMHSHQPRCLYSCSSWIFCAYALVSFMHRNHLFRVWKDS